jgi:hypothetical protein
MRTELGKLCDEHNVTIACKHGVEEWPDNWKRSECTAWTVTLSRPGCVNLTTNFFQGLAHTSEPTAADVLSCLVMDADVLDHDCFDDWANEYGYDYDSRSAEKIYDLCLEQAPKVRAFLGDDFEAFQRAEH